MRDEALTSTLDWLMSPTCPPIRYLTARDLNTPPSPASDLQTFRQQVLEWEPLQQILRLQRDDGSFPPGQKTPTAQPTFTALTVFQRSALDINDEPVQRAVDYLTHNHLDKGALSYTSGGSGILPCYVGTVVLALVKMGALDTELAQSSIQWLIDHQRFDSRTVKAGGEQPWPFKAPENYGCWQHVSCYHGVAAAFRAFAAIPPTQRSNDVQVRLGQAIDYLRPRRLYKKSRTDQPLFRHMKQPFLVGDYRFDLLDMLSGIADADPALVHEDWVAEAIDDMNQLAIDGRVVLAKNYGRKLIDPIPLEPVGQPSRFLTYQWLQTQRHLGLATEPSSADRSPMPGRSSTAVDAESTESQQRVIHWLLEGDPAIRWQVKRDLLHAPADDVEAERALVSTTGWGRQLLDHQDPEGTWAAGLYSPKWTSTTYTLLLLRHCGLDPADPQAQRGVTLIWDGARYFDGGLTPAVTVDAPEACATSLYLALAYYFDVEHPNVDGALDWLLANQLDDGGWNCRTVRFGDRHSSFHTSISALEALAEAHTTHPDRADITDAMAAGREFFLQHHLYKSRRHGTIADPAFTKLSFPPRWHYDLLRGLDHFATVAAPWDDRHRDALEVLQSRRRRDGTWPVQHKHPGRVWFDMEQTGRPSRWNTLRALRVQRWSHQASSL